MSTVIGVFGDSVALEKAIVRLNEQGLEEQVFDRSLMAQEVGTGVKPVVTPGVTAAPGTTGMAGAGADQSHQTLLNAFRRHLESAGVDDKLLKHYVNSFDHGARFVLVKASGERAEAALTILKAAGAAEAARHG